MPIPDPLKALRVSISDIQPNSESDQEHKITIPYLERIKDYTRENDISMVFRKAKNVSIGGRMEIICPDIAVYVEKEPFLMIDSKPINTIINIEDINQAISYARLYELPKQFAYSIVSTGQRWEVYDTLNGEPLGDHNAIPDSNRAKIIIRKGIRQVPQAKAEEAQRILEARRLIRDKQKLHAIFKQCQTRIEAEGKHGHEALMEISKMILAKIYEEEFHVKEDRTYRFSLEFFSQQKRDFPDKNETDLINEIFHTSNRKYRGNRPDSIFPEESLITLSAGTVKKIIELLEKPAFYGGGEDIKGAVYETFLKTVFRGEFGQFFTPREVVNFMVYLADPKPNEKVIDPACGSGGFLLNSFIQIRKKILGLKSAHMISQDEANQNIEKLLTTDLWGTDVAEALVQFCKINLIIQGDGYQNIYRVNALDKNLQPLKNMEEKFNVVLTNPPFDLPSEHLEDVIGQYRLFKEYGYTGADVLYLERSYELLAPGGRMAIVVPHRFIDGKEFENLRVWMLERMIPRAIVNLPVGTFKPFGGSNARTSILYMRKLVSDKERSGRTLMATVRSVGFDTGIQEYKPIEKNDLDGIITSQFFYDLKTEEEEHHSIY